jgi:hypothetical protein
LEIDLRRFQLCFFQNCAILTPSEIRRQFVQPTPEEAIVIINHSNPAVTSLVAEWCSLHHEGPADKKRASLALQRALAVSVLAPAVNHHPGELILFYHKFLARRPTGGHSFAYGSEMVTDDEYVVLVGRIGPAACIVETPETESIQFAGTPLEYTIVFSPRFLLSTAWWTQLWPGYVHSNHPTRYVTRRPDEKDSEFHRMPLDLSAFAQHLFPIRTREFDWAVEMEFAIGNDSVASWLLSHGSGDAWSELSVR